MKEKGNCAAGPRAGERKSGVKKLSFEKAMAQLEAIVREMESSELPLERALKKFEEGIQLSQYCSQLLDETEQKVTLLLRDPAGNVTETPFPEAATDEHTSDDS